jgi:hypothetical protein
MIYSIERTIKFALAEYVPIEPVFMIDGKVSPLQRWLKEIIDLDKIIKIEDPYIEQVPYHIGSMLHRDEPPLIKISIIIQGETPYIKNWVVPSSIEHISEEEYAYNSNLPQYYKYGDHKPYKTVYNSEEWLKKCQEVIVNDLVKIWRLYKEGYNKLILPSI